MVTSLDWMIIDPWSDTVLESVTHAPSSRSYSPLKFYVPSILQFPCLKKQSSLLEWCPSWNGLVWIKEYAKLQGQFPGNNSRYIHCLYYVFLFMFRFWSTEDWFYVADMDDVTSGMYCKSAWSEAGPKRKHSYFFH